MNGRRATLIEDGAREQLQRNGYRVRIVPSVYDPKMPSVHLIATRPPDETRFIRIWPASHTPLAARFVERNCRQAVAFFRRKMAQQPGPVRPRYEIWAYTITYGFRVYEVLSDCVREIPRFAGEHLPVRRRRGAV